MLLRQIHSLTLKTRMLGFFSRGSKVALNCIYYKVPVKTISTLNLDNFSDDWQYNSMAQDDYEPQDSNGNEGLFQFNFKQKVERDEITLYDIKGKYEEYQRNYQIYRKSEDILDQYRNVRISSLADIFTEVCSSHNDLGLTFYIYSILFCFNKKSSFKTLSKEETDVSFENIKRTMGKLLTQSNFNDLSYSEQIRILKNALVIQDYSNKETFMAFIRNLIREIKFTESNPFNKGDNQVVNSFDIAFSDFDILLNYAKMFLSFPSKDNEVVHLSNDILEVFINYNKAILRDIVSLEKILPSLKFLKTSLFRSKDLSKRSLDEINKAVLGYFEGLDFETIENRALMNLSSILIVYFSTNESYEADVLNNIYNNILNILNKIDFENTLSVEDNLDIDFYRDFTLKFYKFSVNVLLNHSKSNLLQKKEIITNLFNVWIRLKSKEDLGMSAEIPTLKSTRDKIRHILILKNLYYLNFLTKEDPEVKNITKGLKNDFIASISRLISLKELIFTMRYCQGFMEQDEIDYCIETMTLILGQLSYDNLDQLTSKINFFISMNLKTKLLLDLKPLFFEKLRKFNEELEFFENGRKAVINIPQLLNILNYYSQFKGNKQMPEIKDITMESKAKQRSKVTRHTKDIILDDYLKETKQDKNQSESLAPRSLSDEELIHSTVDLSSNSTLTASEEQQNIEKILNYSVNEIKSSTETLSLNSQNLALISNLCSLYAKYKKKNAKTLYKSVINPMLQLNFHNSHLYDHFKLLDECNRIILIMANTNNSDYLYPHLKLMSKIVYGLINHLEFGNLVKRKELIKLLDRLQNIYYYHPKQFDEISGKNLNFMGYLMRKNNQLKMDKDKKML